MKYTLWRRNPALTSAPDPPFRWFLRLYVKKLYTRLKPLMVKHPQAFTNMCNKTLHIRKPPDSAGLRPVFRIV